MSNKKTMQYLLLLIPITLLFLLLLFDQPALNEFFFWMDGYIALPVDRPYSMPLTYYFRGEVPNLLPEDIKNIAIPNVDSASAAIYNVQYFTPNSLRGYHACVYTIGIEFSKTGKYRIDELELHMADDKIKLCPIGNWTFDIDRESNLMNLDEQADFISASDYATSDSSVYSYSFHLPSSNMEITSLSYWTDQCIVSGTGIEPNGTLPLSESDAPVKVIRPKLVLSIEGNDYVTYGSTCSCGALEVTKDDVIASINYMKDRM